MTEKTMTENGITKVRFSLWAVLAFLILLAAMGGGYLFNTQAAEREKLQAVKEEVIVLRQHYNHILEKLTIMSVQMDKVVDEVQKIRYRPDRRNN